MFHIFRWRRNTVDQTNDEENGKKAHARRNRLRLQHARPSLERLFHLRRHRSASAVSKIQVMSTENRPKKISLSIARLR